jgi:hypothetical protein
MCTSLWITQDFHSTAQDSLNSYCEGTRVDRMLKRSS